MMTGSVVNVPWPISAAGDDDGDGAVGARS